MKKQTFLERQSLPQQPNRLKYQHLLTQNTHLSQTVCQLQSHVQSLRRINEELLKKGGSSVPLLVSELTAQNRNLQRSLFRLVRRSQQLSCDVLMKEQLLAQAQRQHRDIVDNYDEKIYELRISLQSKETAVSAMEDKMSQLREDTYGTATRVNLVYFNEINQLKAMHDRLALENSQLTFLNALKDEEIERLKLALQQAERSGQRKSPQKRKEVSLGEGSASKTRKLQARVRLQEQLTRYDNKYKHLSSSKNISASQVSSLKFFITHLHKENRDLRAEKVNVEHSLANKGKQYRMLQEAYQRIRGELLRDRVEVQFYRDNFKELCRVSTQRRIKFYEEIHEEILPNLERRLREKAQLVAYWKQWQGKTSDLIGRCILSRNTRRRLPAKLSSSCPVNFTYTKESPKRRLCPKQKEQAIFSFINETHNINSVVNFTLDGTVRGQQRNFDDDISVIIKPKVVTARRNENGKGREEEKRK